MAIEVLFKGKERERERERERELALVEKLVEE